MKRKRVAEEDKAACYAGKLHHCAKEVKKAAKKAKDFEIRKLVKRLNGLRMALKTKLKKDKQLSENENFVAVTSQELRYLIVPAQPGSNLAKVQGRLLSHNATEASDGELHEDVPLRPMKKVKMVSADPEETDSGDSGDESSLNNRVTICDEEEVADDGWDSGIVHGESYGEEEEDNKAEDNGVASEVKTEHGESDDEDTVSRSKQPLRKAPLPRASTSKQGESKFLPSLAVGFTRGDSDESDLSDAEVARAEGGARKNRRGQRARRTIWEKKYGKNANHFKKHEIFGAVKGYLNKTSDRDVNGSRDNSRKPRGNSHTNKGPHAQAQSRNVTYS
ncbi:uncharacterized protein PHACADRAFT_246291 [Phanerochaete carnosa HHB-10118-sp]|uniref:Bud22 domain-containing protein n=1 Tax=Phanerochaete carnosa (strain HHB-10118-sp) TaxID=650164 RepID=K5XBR2_PHACS|nr:uncharacterized protein PHACADRAFT_246291 [Phanerochaete carnosa HHB-10118-sp]EKM60402.1 hypothetical protein PHACADRAFT_246291 [Phanerochaete carnosa HHB-10118-sp]